MRVVRPTAFRAGMRRTLPTLFAPGQSLKKGGSLFWFLFRYPHDAAGAGVPRFVLRGNLPAAFADPGGPNRSLCSSCLAAEDPAICAHVVPRENPQLPGRKRYSLTRDDASRHEDFLHFPWSELEFLERPREESNFRTRFRNGPFTVMPCAAECRDISVEAAKLVVRYASRVG